MRKFIVLTLGLILIAAACNKQEPAVNGDTVSTPPPAANPSPAATNMNEIKMTSAGFEPSAITVKKGTTVTFINNDSQNRWPASGPHPSHTDYSEFDPKNAIAAGQSWSFKFDKVGTWRFHDHLNPTKFGSVTVME